MYIYIYIVCVIYVEYIHLCIYKYTLITDVCLYICYECVCMHTHNTCTHTHACTYIHTHARTHTHTHTQISTNTIHTLNAIILRLCINVRIQYMNL